MTVLVFIIAVVTNLVIIGIMVNRGDADPTVTAHPQAQEPPAVVPAPALTPGLATTFGEGKFVVGTDIAPSAYRTTGPSGRLTTIGSASSAPADRWSDPDSIIANNLGRGPATVTIDNKRWHVPTPWCSTSVKVS